MSGFDNKSNSIQENSNKIKKGSHLKDSIKKYGRNLFGALAITASIAGAPSLSAQNNKVDSIGIKEKTEVLTNKEFCFNLNPKSYAQAYPFVLPEHIDSFVFKLTMKNNEIAPLHITINEETDGKIISVIDPSGKKIVSDSGIIVIDKIGERNISYQKGDLIKNTKVVFGYSYIPVDIHDRREKYEEYKRPHVIIIGEDEKEKEENKMYRVSKGPNQNIDHRVWKNLDSEK